MREKFFVTTPIYYVNDMPHLGHAYTSVLADIFARYHRLNGDDVFYLTGTDEHGAKICRSAEEKKEDVKKFTDKNSLKFKELFKLLNISNDDFIRTTDKKRHWPSVKKIWKKIEKKGDIYKGNYKGFYCVGCEAFVTEKDLVKGKCVYHNKKPEKIEEKNYFFRLSNYTDEIKQLVKNDIISIVPESRKKETLSFLEGGLNDISISRPSKDIKWGIPVPDDSSQTIYVWFDALVNYLSAKKFWPADLHIMAKDIMRFHTIIWSAMLLSADLPLPKKNLVHGFINIEGRKMSKTVGNVVSPFDIIERYGADTLRYYFSREITPFDDGDFTEEKFKEAYNANLANGLGNYVSRVFKMVFSYFDGVIKQPSDVVLSGIPFVDEGKESFSVPYVFEHKFWPEYKKQMDEMKVNIVADVVWSAMSYLDGYIQNYVPFKLIKTDKEKTEAVLWSLLYGLANISIMIYPFMPETAEKIMKALGIKGNKNIPKDFSLKEIDNLFPRIE